MSNRPNILLLYTDQQRWDALGAAGNPDIVTPNFDRLAAEGLRFDRFFVQNPVCMPSRASLLTGLYPSTLGIQDNGVPLPESCVTLPMMLRNYGYTSANLGKLHFLPHAGRDHRDVHPPYGFDILEISDEPGCYPDAYRAWVAREAPEQLDALSVGLPPAADAWQGIMGKAGGEGIRHPEKRFIPGARAFEGDSRYTHTAFVAERTMAFLDEERPGPFFAIAGFYSPHSPWVAPQEYLDLYDPDTLALPPPPEEGGSWESRQGFETEAQVRSARQGYYAMVSEVDHHVGRILDKLDARGQRENTIVIFTSDHGEYLGDYGRWGKGFPAHDCIGRVPMVVRWPAGIRQPGRTVDGIVEAVDILPTLLECAGIPAPGYLQGRSVAAMFSDANAPGRDSALTEGNGRKSLRTERCRYTIDRYGVETLFDLEADPNALTDVADRPDYGEVLSSHRKRLIERTLDAEALLPRTWAY